MIRWSNKRPGYVATIRCQESSRDVVDGRVSAQDAVKEFMTMWRKAGDSSITWEEFYEFYADIGAFIADDDEFELLIRNQWHLQGGAGVLS